LEIVGMQMWDANLVQKIVTSNRRKLSLVVGLHVCSGGSIFCLSEVEAEEDLQFDVKFRNTDYIIVIELKTKCIV
jgi:hypothetical protein